MHFGTLEIILLGIDFEYHDLMYHYYSLPYFQLLVTVLYFLLNLVLLFHRAYPWEDCSSLWDLHFVDDEEIHVLFCPYLFRRPLVWSRPGPVDKWLLAIT